MNWGLTETDILALENDLLSIEDWIAGAMGGTDHQPVQKILAAKVAACRRRMAQQARDVLLADPAVDMMPATEDGLIRALAARPEYKNRREREEQPAVVAALQISSEPATMSDALVARMRPGETPQQAANRILPDIRIRHDELTQLMHLGRATPDQRGEHTTLSELLLELAQLGDTK